MLGKIPAVHVGDLDRIPAVDHFAIADIDSDMACARCVVSSLEENDVSRLPLGFRDGVAPLADSLRCGSSDMPDTGMIDDPADKAAAVKPG